MRKNLYILIIYFILITTPQLSFGQSTIYLKGYIVDTATEEGLAGATIMLKERPELGAVTDADGYFQLAAPAGQYTLVVKYIGYDPTERTVIAEEETVVKVGLQPTAYGVKEVEVVAERHFSITETTTMGGFDIPMETVKSLPSFLGEPDILKTVQLLPGIKSGSEGNTGFSVRGGGSDQNLVQLDKAVVYNPGHLFNFFSVFNGDAISSATLLKGSIPASYGGRLSSVLDISMREGSNEQYKIKGGIGLIASRLAVEGPIKKDKSSFIFSSRRTYLDALMKPFQGSNNGSLPYYFYDLNGKLTFELSDKDELYLSGYYGKDVGSMNLSAGRFDADFHWGNATATARWKHIINRNHSFDVSATLSHYDFGFDWTYGGFDTNVSTGVQDYAVKADAQYSLGKKHRLQYGMQHTYHLLKPQIGRAKSTDGETYTNDRVRPKQGYETAFYVSDDWSVGNRLLISLGVRASFFALRGPYTLYSFDQNEKPVDSVSFSAGETVKPYRTPEPRIAMRYQLTKNAALKASYTRSAQYLHLVSSANTTLPMDVWVPSSSLVQPQRATQYALGYYHTMRKNEYEASVELYYKNMQNQLEYRQGYTLGSSNRDIEYEFVSGTGKAYGIEFQLSKTYGRLQGWAAYTLAHATRTFPAINEGRTFPDRFDRRHDASLVATYKLNRRWTFGGNFVYATGQATTLPVRSYIIDGGVNYQYGDRNSFRMEPFHRLDLSATLEGKSDKKIQSSWVFSVYNVYGRHNPFLYYLDNQGTAYGSNQVQAKKVSLIPFPLPSVTWNFKI